MAGRGRLPLAQALNAGRGPLAGPGPLRAGPGPYGSGMHLPMGPGLDVLEHKLATQHADIQGLLAENQRLAATHLALRQELGATNQELQRMQQALMGVQSEKEQHIRALSEKSSKLEVELQATEPLKAELQNLQADAQKLLAHRQELTAQIQQITQDLHRSRAESQQLPSLEAEVEGLRKEIQRARSAFEYEKKANMDLLDQRQVMEKNLVSLAREVEKLRAELATVENKSRGSGYGGGYGGPDSGYPPNMYRDGYVGQMGAAPENGGGPFGSGPPSSRGNYDMQRAGAPLARR